MSKEVEISEDELRSTLMRLNWKELEGAKPEFIVKMVVKKILASGVKVSIKHGGQKIVVNPVTVIDYKPVIGGSSYVYEQFRGWEGEVISERNNGVVDLVKVKINRGDGTRDIETEILKRDLSYE